ncbi:MAG: DUF763 domain-containing protein [Sedimentisphaerales bacterium]|nr:DUF763 domain-containing protein [Sedimentisphaerales bacterium]
MMKRGIATFTLDTGTCPRWLFEKMVRLGREMTRVLIAEFGPDEFIRRIADPVWFQSLGTVLAFDWNASGLTTILTAALKEAIRGREQELGIFICGGKGKTSRKTPDEIITWADRLSLADKSANNLVYNSRMAAKVDSSLIQDGYQIYHHSFFFSRKGSWAVVQQGMNPANVSARRYHWFSENIQDLVCEPHTGIISSAKRKSSLNLTACASEASRDISVELISSGYNPLMNDIQIISRHSSNLSKMVRLKTREHQMTLLNLKDVEFKTHPVIYEDFSKSTYLKKILHKLCDMRPGDYENLLAVRGVGPKTIRALALVGELIYGAQPSYQDPARYSFAHGGKDATPYPIDRKTYDKTIAIMAEAVVRSRIQPYEKDRAIRRLTRCQ